MSDEAVFQAALDDRLADGANRLLFADWLAERGDWRAPGYRFMAEHAKHPYRSYATWEWWSFDSENTSEIRLEDELWQPLPVVPPPGYPRCKEWVSRRKAEEALCRLIRTRRRKKAPAANSAPARTIPPSSTPRTK